jgi:hypothetical protein
MQQTPETLSGVRNVSTLDVIYTHIKLCQGCAPRHVDASILIIPIPPNPLPLTLLGCPVHLYMCELYM